YYPEFDERISADPRAANRGIAEDSDGEETVNVFARAKYHAFTFNAFVSSRQKTVPTASFGAAFNSGRQRTDEHRGYVDVLFEHRFESELQLHGRAFFDQYRYDGDYPYEYAEPGEPSLLINNRDEAMGEWVGTEWQVTLP